MALLTYRDRPIDIEPGETVLSALLRTGVDAPNSCRAGVCQTCLHRAVDGEIPPAARQGLTDAQKALGYFLACVCLPETPLAIVPADEAARRMGVVVRSIDRLSASVVRLRLRAETRFDYISGQFLELIAPGGLERHYSLASLPDDDPFLELHIRLLDGGRMSGLIANSLAPGDRLSVAGPRGSCVYEGAAPDQPLVLAGAGTGLAPLWGICATRCGANIGRRSASITARATRTASILPTNCARSRRRAPIFPTFPACSTQRRPAAATSRPP